MRQLIDALPHITVSDELRKAPMQPAEIAFDAAEIHGLTPEVRRRGIKNPMAIMATLESLGAGRGGAVGEDAGAHPLRRPRRRRQRAGHRSPSRAQGVDAGHADAPGHARLALPRHQRHHPRRPPGREDRRTARLQHDACRRPRARASMPRWSGCSAPASAPSTRARPTCWSRPAQILAQQTGLVNEIRVRVTDPMAAAGRGAAHRARDRLQIGGLAGGARGPAQRLRRSATSSCTRSSAPSCWWRASAPTTSSPPSRTRRRATSPS